MEIIDTIISVTYPLAVIFIAYFAFKHLMKHIIKDEINDAIKKLNEKCMSLNAIRNLR